MKLTLKEDFTYYVTNSRKSVTEVQSDVIAAIRDLEKLYNYSSLSEEELKELLAKYYDWVPYFESEKDIEAISRSILKSQNITHSIVATSIVNRSYNPRYLDIKVYYDKDSGFDINHTYTFSELQELISARKIVVETLLWTDKEVTKEEAHNVNLNDVLFLPTIDKITLENFWGYEDIMLPCIKRRLEKNKVHRDIMRIINSMRAKLKSENNKFLARRADLCASLSQNAADIDIRNNYIKELSSLGQYPSEEGPKRA